jgi:hypothetical protein
VFIDLDVVEKILKDHGFTAVEFQDVGDYFIYLCGPKGEMRISNHFFGRIAAEFLNLRWAVNEMGSLAANPFREDSSDESQNPQKGPS